jgi:hypothetical protein
VTAAVPMKGEVKCLRVIVEIDEDVFDYRAGDFLFQHHWASGSNSQ